MGHPLRWALEGGEIGACVRPTLRIPDAELNEGCMTPYSACEAVFLTERLILARLGGCETATWGTPVEGLLRAVKTAVRAPYAENAGSRA